ncbi:MAG: hypothetical protein ACRYGM_05395 [Janthinobacterium lividum]|jgi:hypothetical protein
MTKITLLLAQGPGKPDGDVSDRLVMNLALNSQGQIDSAAYDAAPEPWLATRENPDAKALEVIRVDEGWALQSTNGWDDPIWTFEGYVYRPGELVQLRRPDGEQLLFRIVALEAG